MLVAALEKASSEGIKAESKLIEILNKKISNVIIEEAVKWEADLIVIGTHGRRGINHLMLGSDTEAVVRASPIPVLTIRNQSSST